MKNYCKTIGALVVASAFAAGNVSAEVESEVSLGYTNEYLFRGVNLGQQLVEASLNVATEYNGLDLSAGLWHGSFDNAGVNNNELDLYAEVAKDLGFATAAIGYINYQNDKSFDVDYAEVYFSLAREIYGIETSLAYYWDVENDNDGYLELGAGKGFELSPCLTLSTGAKLGYLVEQGQLGHLTAKVALDYAYSETATISPFVSHAWSLSDDVNTVYGGSKNEFVAGTMLSVSF